MYKDIISILMCPECRSKLKLIGNKSEGEEITAGKLVCEDGHEWFIRDGIVDFMPHEQDFANNWSQENLEETEKMAKEKTPPELSTFFYKTKTEIAGYIDTNKPSFAADIATGRGMLLTELLEKVSYETQLVAIDLSYAVLNYNRTKMRSKNSNVKVNYIACNAANLPFQDDVFDIVVSFFGIQNMMNLVTKGVSESRRVLKEGSSLLNAVLTIKGNSKANDILQQFSIENDLTPYIDFVTYEGIEKVYRTAGFDSMEIKAIGEGTGEKNELDLIPCEGEWYAVNIAYSKK